jgi:hypothetical protein
MLQAMLSALRFFPVGALLAAPSCFSIISDDDTKARNIVPVANTPPILYPRRLGHEQRVVVQ